jgi:hypothetical protein
LTRLRRSIPHRLLLRGAGAAQQHYVVGVLALQATAPIAYGR